MLTAWRIGIWGDVGPFLALTSGVNPSFWASSLHLHNDALGLMVSKPFVVLMLFQSLHVILK